MEGKNREEVRAFLYTNAARFQNRRMNYAGERRHRLLLRDIARRAMLDKGLAPDFAADALAEVGAIHEAAADGTARDLTGLAWCSIDNDDSRDLDQLTVGEALPGGATKILVAIADVDALVPKDCALDQHARQNTTSVYTAAQIFPMLPERLSTDLTSLNYDVPRLAMVIEMTFAADASLQGSEIYRATVRNKAKLAYGSVGAWLEGKGPRPKQMEAEAGLEENLRLQNRMAQSLKAARHAAGSLDLETIKPRPLFDGDEIRDLVVEPQNQANDLIADFMIAANGVTARYLEAKGMPAVRRIVRTPKRWDRIVELAAQWHGKLPGTPDSGALEEFLAAARASKPVEFPDLSLCVVKLLGPGEYVVQYPGAPAVGHFGLAVRDYAHSTAPNRRYPDVLTQRLVKAALSGAPSPFASGELTGLAQHCTEAESAAKKVERQVAKSAAAMLLESKIGAQYDAIVTGASDKGTWVRIFHPPVEGRLQSGFGGLDVGDRLRVQLIHTDANNGFIDFKRLRK